MSDQRLDAAMKAYANTPWSEDYFRQAMHAALEAADAVEMAEVRDAYGRVVMVEVEGDEV